MKTASDIVASSSDKRNFKARVFAETALTTAVSVTKTFMLKERNISMHKLLFCMLLCSPFISIRVSHGLRLLPILPPPPPPHPLGNNPDGLGDVLQTAQHLKQQPLHK